MMLGDIHSKMDICGKANDFITINNSRSLFATVCHRSLPGFKSCLRYHYPFKVSAVFKANAYWDVVLRFLANKIRRGHWF